MELATQYLAKYPTRQQAYNMLQVALWKCFIRRGGSKDAWVARYAEPFGRRHGWMLTGEN
jgi:hypothetical protein